MSGRRLGGKVPEDWTCNVCLKTRKEGACFNFSDVFRKKQNTYKMYISKRCTSCVRKRLTIFDRRTWRDKFKEYFDEKGV